MRSLIYIVEVILIIAWLIGFFVYGANGLNNIPLTVVKFDAAAFAKMFRRMLRMAVFCGLVVFLPGCSAHYVAEVPTAPIEVRPVAPFAGAVWIDGGWAWRGGRHTWVGGYWDHPRRGRAWQAGEWRHGPHGHYWVRGRWR